MFAHHHEQWQQSENRQHQDRELNSGAQSISQTLKRGWFLSTAQTLPSERGPGTPLYRKEKQRKYDSSLYIKVQVKNVPSFQSNQLKVCMN